MCLIFLVEPEGYRDPCQPDEVNAYLGETGDRARSMLCNQQRYTTVIDPSKIEASSTMPTTNPTTYTFNKDYICMTVDSLRTHRKQNIYFYGTY